jgi:hypothetical protein
MAGDHLVHLFKSASYSARIQAARFLRRQGYQFDGMDNYWITCSFFDWFVSCLSGICSAKGCSKRIFFLDCSVSWFFYS